MPGEVVHGFWVAVLHGASGRLRYPKGGRAKVRGQGTEDQVETPAIANVNRLVFRQAAHIEWGGSRSEVGAVVGHALAVCNTTAGSVVGLVVDRTKRWGDEGRQRRPRHQVRRWRQGTRIDTDPAMV